VTTTITAVPPVWVYGRDLLLHEVRAAALIVELYEPSAASCFSYHCAAVIVAPGRVARSSSSKPYRRPRSCLPVIA